MTPGPGVRVSAAAPRGGAAWPVLPSYGRGQAIGLLGGSFNPPHEGHFHISELALARLGLDRVWWLVTPGNPLKSHAELAPTDARVRAARRIVDNPRVQVTALEVDIGTSRTRDTLRFMRRRAGDARLVWLMGADNLAGFHRWDRWQEIFARVPIAVFARPGQRLAALNSPAVRRFEQSRLAAGDAALLGRRVPPAWVWLDMRMRPESSTALRLRARLGANGGGACRNAGKGTGD